MRQPIDARSHREKLAARLKARLAQQFTEPKSPIVLTPEQRRQLEYGLMIVRRNHERYELNKQDSN